MPSPFATMTSFGPPPDFTPPGSTSTSSPSSSNNSNNGNSDDLFSADHPWAWVLIPVLLLSSLGLLAACLHNSRRHRVARKQLQQSLAAFTSQPTLSRPPQTSPLSRYAVRDLSAQRDLESGYFSPGQEAARWAWPRPPPPEEGLNELGEAPPPYENNEKSTAELAAAGSEIVEVGEGSMGRELDGVELQELEGSSPVQDLRKAVLTRRVVSGGGSGTETPGSERSVRSWVEGDDEIDTRSMTTTGSQGCEKKEEILGTGYDSGSETDSDSEDERGSSSSDHVYNVAEEVVISQPPPAVLRDSDSGRQQQQRKAR